MSLWAIFVCLSGQCLAERAGSIQESGQAVLALVEAKQFDAAEAAVAKMQTAFAGDPNLPLYLYKIADKYRSSGGLSYARSHYEQIVSQYPDSRVAARAGMYLALFAVEELIDEGDYPAAEAAIAKMQSDFSGHSLMPGHLLRIANKYRSSGNVSACRSLCEHIASQYPSDKFAGDARLFLAFFSVADLIAQGDYPAAEAAVVKMKADFSGNHYLPGELYRIANGYRKAGEASRSRSLCEQIVSQYPDSGVAAKARMSLAAFGAEGLIDKGDYAGAEAEISRMQSAFAGNTHMPGRLLRVAGKLQNAGQADRARQLYTRVRDDYSLLDPSGAADADADIKIRDLVASGDIEKLDSVINEAVSRPNVAKGRLYNLARYVQRSGYPASAAAIFGRIAAGGGSSDVEVYSAAYEVLIEGGVWSQIDADVDAGVTAGKALLKSRFPDPQQHVLAAHAFGEGLYEKALGIYRDDPEDAGLAAMLLEIATLYGERVIGQTARKDLLGEAHLTSAECYEILGVPTLAREHYQQYVKLLPQDTSAGYCLQMVGRCIEKELSQGLISEADAAPMIKGVYERVVAEYPNCSSADYARDWLEKNAK